MPTKDFSWLLSYFSVAWTGHICQGLAIGILGPTQPYLAHIVGVPKEQVNFIWTGRGAGSCVATLLTGMVFKRLVTKKWQKLCFLAASVACSGVFIGFVPFLSSFSVLLAALLIAGFCIACFNTASNSLVVFMLGSDRSRPFIQSLHASLATGYMLGSLIVRPFLPETNDDSSACGFNAEVFDTTHNLHYIQNKTTEEVIENVPDITKPFLIIAMAHIVTGIAFIFLVMGGFPMPQYEQSISKDVETLEQKVSNEKEEKKNSTSPFLLLLVLLWFFISGGLEGFFQSQTYTFGICGPHLMEPGKAAALTTVYFSCFLAGRVSGVFLSTRLSPGVLILCSQVGCFSSALLLVFLAGWREEALFIGTAAVGFCVSLQVGVFPHSKMTATTFLIRILLASPACGHDRDHIKHHLPGEQLWLADSATHSRDGVWVGWA